MSTELSRVEWLKQESAVTGEARSGSPRSRQRVGLMSAWIWPMLLLAGLTGCQTFHATAPEGFAAYPVRQSFRAVSPDGVVFRVRAENNEPRAELPFWKEALKKRMLDAGYHFVRETDMKAAGQDAYLLELNAPFGTQDYTYLIALFERDRHLILVESAGEVTRFEARRSAVVAAIEKLAF